MDFNYPILFIHIKWENRFVIKSSKFFSYFLQIFKQHFLFQHFPYFFRKRYSQLFFNYLISLIYLCFTLKFILNFKFSRSHHFLPNSFEDFDKKIGFLERLNPCFFSNLRNKSLLYLVLFIWYACEYIFHSN